MTNIIEIKRRFFNSLKRGTGEAYLIAKENPSIDFSPYIIKGALRNYAYDGQSEGTRAQYVFDIISLSDKKEKIRKKVLKGLATEQDDTWSLVHLFDLAKLYAQQGDEEARQAIYNRFLNHPVDYADWVGYNQILELDGLQGMFFIAEKFGNYIYNNPDVWQNDSIIQHFQSDNLEINVMKELKKESKNNKFIKLYLAYIKENDKSSAKANDKKITVFNNVIDEVINSNHFLSITRIKKLTESELILIADRLLIEKNIVNKEKLIKIFCHQKFPLDSNFILELAKQRASSKNRVNEFAIKALRFLKSDSIREFAMNRLQQARRPESYLDMLVCNYIEGDYKLLTSLADKSTNEHVIEWLSFSFVAIFEANKTQECKEPLESLYNKMNCGIHRNSVIKILIANGVISDRMKYEIQHDSYLETRELGTR